MAPEIDLQEPLPVGRARTEVVWQNPRALEMLAAQEAQP